MAISSCRLRRARGANSKTVESRSSLEPSDICACTKLYVADYLTAYYVAISLISYLLSLKIERINLLEIHVQCSLHVGLEGVCALFLWAPGAVDCTRDRERAWGRGKESESA